MDNIMKINSITDKTNTVRAVSLIKHVKILKFDGNFDY